ncbi:MAG TPA: NAD(P)/FAD-dependent oxidoreductase [Vicinamibacterales bacterium]|nr:NAD(P)/FAD-dependent oxidoreductase [Vicinamibacterales bacterium]
MTNCDALIVGGGPAGSSCAQALRGAGWDVIIIDRAGFPRDKVCAGWLTPDVFRLLNLAPAEYRAAGLTLQEIVGFRTGLLRRPSVDTPYGRVVSYAIRRREFDEFLLRRADVRVLEQTPLTSLRQDGRIWVVNEQIRTPLVIGAGGHFCPVARRVRDRAAPSRPVVAKEAEYRLDGRVSTVAPNVAEFFFCDDLDGYGWCVRKGEYLNVGLGRRSNTHFAAHIDDFISFLEGSGKAPGASGLQWRGHAYLASGVGTRPVVADGLMLIGDAAGLAYPESGEGIRPAIESARVAAQIAIAAGGRYGEEDLRPYQAAISRLHPGVRRASAIARSVQTAIGGALLQSPAFTRHVILDRWFLRRG